MAGIGIMNSTFRYMYHILGLPIYLFISPTITAMFYILPILKCWLDCSWNYKLGIVTEFFSIPSCLCFDLNIDNTLGFFLPYHMVYTSASKAWGYTGTTLSVCLSACL